ncbi:hypothetical protein [Streptomyces sp. NPDC046759]|uniref:hypothetical protein n=1 Tax=Streptomyces sp. NPDC046759 TaxID=3155019 RepID=UPI0033CA0496
MTFPAAPLGTTVRVLRTAAGRRALQLVLLVGGLFTLGFLCGEQAHAADGPPVPVTPVRSVGAGHADPVRPVLPVPPVTVVRAVPTADAVPVSRAVRTLPGQVAAPVHRVTERLAAPVHLVTEPLNTPVHRVTERAVSPVRDVVTAVSRSLESAATRAVERPEASAPPVTLPDLTHVPGAPVQLTPDPRSAGPRPQSYGGAAVAAPVEQGPRHARAQGRTAVGASAQTAPYGPEAFSAPQSALRSAPHSVAHREAAAVSVPGLPAPTGDPDAVLGKQAVDGGASRHGDAHAVTLGDRVPLWLAPGTTARVDASRTRERHRDIPVFPG